MLPECLRNVCQRKSSMENYKRANAPMVVRRSDTKDTLKASLKDFNIPTESREQIARTEQSGEASSEEMLVNMRQNESAKPSRNVHSAKPELRHHQQSLLPLTSVVPSDSLELELV